MTSADLGFTTLLDWLEGRLDESASRRVADAVTVADPETLETVAWIKEFLSASRLMPLEAPPPEVSARLRDIFAEHVASHGGSDWSTATLLHDTRQPQAAAGMRSAGTLGRVSLAFDSELGRFVMEATSRGDGTVDIEGMLALRSPGEYDVNLSFVRGEQVCGVVRPGRDGRFAAAGVPDDVDELWLVDARTKVRAPLDLRPT